MRLVNLGIFLGSIFLLSACVDEVTLDLKQAPERLVIDASINWVEGSDGAVQTIQLTRSTAFYDYAVPTAEGATVSITDQTGTVFNFTSTKNQGIYKCEDFVPVVGRTYFLTVIYNGQVYTSQNVLMDTPEITSIIQKEDGGVFGDALEIKPYFQDPVEQENYYMFRFKDKSLNQPDYQIIKDEFFNGNLMFGIYTSAEGDDYELKKGDTLNIQLYGINKRNYEYLNILFEQTGNNGAGSPFGTIPSNAKGNILNQTVPANYPYGYFRLSKVSERNYVVK